MPTIPPDSHLIGKKLGNYRLERLLGRGRMGMVYLAHDEALLRPIAIKLLAWNLPDAQHHDPEAWLLAEARNIARVNHPAVIQVYGVARHGQYAYIAMEFVDGVAADRWVEERGPFAPAVATQILLQIGGALQAAHECGVIHRDVKPANILLKSDGLAKLGDFGMAIHRQTPALANGEHQVGTPLYTAPELWAGAPATPVTDLYALGATYFFLLTGHAPFEATDLPTLIEAHRHQRPARLEQLAARVSPGCIEILRRCLAKSPLERVASAQELCWLARGVLRDIEGGRKESQRPVVASQERRDSSFRALGLTRPPFGSETGGLARLPSFRKVSSELGVALEEPGSVVLLSGAPGSAGPRLLREVLRTSRRSTAWIELAGALANDSVSQRACRAFGAFPSARVSTDPALEGLLEHLANKPGEPAVLVVEGVWSRVTQRELAALASAARATRYFSLVLVGAPEAEHLAGSRSVHVPPLSALDLLSYLRACLQSAAARGTPPLLISPDAALILHHRTRGNLVQAQHLASRMLELAAAQPARVLTSWHAWVATQPVGAPAPALSDWPTSEVLALLNAERSAAGIDPRRVVSQSHPPAPERATSSKDIA